MSYEAAKTHPMSKEIMRSPPYSAAHTAQVFTAKCAQCDVPCELDEATAAADLRQCERTQQEQRQRAEEQTHRGGRAEGRGTSSTPTRYRIAARRPSRERVRSERWHKASA